MGPLTVMVVAALAYAGGAGWYYLSHISVEWGSPKPVEKIVGLYIDCNFVGVPVKLPAEGRINVLFLWPLPVENGGGGLAQIGGIPGSDYRFTDAPYAPKYECKITNYDDLPAVNVDLTLRLRFIEAVRQESGSKQSGKTVLERPWPIRIGKIDSGTNSPFVFYVFNQSGYFVEISFPKEASVQRLGNPTQKTVPITSSLVYPITLVPITDDKQSNVGESKVSP